MLNNFTEPVPSNEKERISSLAEFDIDYSNIESNFKDLAHLAATIAGTEISLVNLIDSVTQWTVSSHGLDLTQMPREESVCQYTIANEGPFEVIDLSKDDRFKERFYVKGPLDLKYYLGIPLSTAEGLNLGALCVLDTQMQSLSTEKIEMLKIIASEIVNRLKAMKTITHLKQQVVKAKEIQKKVAHDIRGPVAGIIGLTGLITQQGPNNNLDEVLECISLIQQSGKSILEVADEILYGDNVEPVKVEEFNLQLFKDKLEHLYGQQANNKNITLDI
jgi:transcriptional regulator with GAF, ATPase, and Fis domain